MRSTHDTPPPDEEAYEFLLWEFYQHRPREAFAALIDEAKTWRRKCEALQKRVWQEPPSPN